MSLFNWSKSLYRKETIPELFFLLVIDTLMPVLSSILDSRLKRSTLLVFLALFLLNFKTLIKCSDWRTDNFLSIIFFAKKNAFSRPTKIFACPWEIFSSIINSKTSLGKESNLRQLDIWALLFPINLETLSWS